MHLRTQHTCTGSLLSSSCVDAVSPCSHHAAECADGHIRLVEQALEPSHLSTKGMRLCLCLRARAQALWDGRQVKMSAHASRHVGLWFGAGRGGGRGIGADIVSEQGARGLGLSRAAFVFSHVGRFASQRRLLEQQRPDHLSLVRRVLPL